MSPMHKPMHYEGDNQGAMCAPRGIGAFLTPVLRVRASVLAFISPWV